MNKQQYTSSPPVLVTGATGQILLSPSAPDQVELQSACVRAAKQAGGRHLVKLSGAHADPDAAPRFARWLAELFEHLDSDVTDAVATAVGRAPIAFKQFAREHKDDFGLPVNVP